MHNKKGRVMYLPRNEDFRREIRETHPEVSEDFVPRTLLPAPVLIDGADDPSHRMHLRSLDSVGKSEFEPTETSAWVIEEPGTPHTRITHELIGCKSRAVMDLAIRTSYYVQNHNRGVMLSGVEDPFADHSRSWAQVQFHNLSMGDRVISLFNDGGTCIALWTCFWVPRVPKFRIMMLGSELAYEFNHGFPVEKQFASVRFPMSDEDREAIEVNRAVSES